MEFKILDINSYDVYAIKEVASLKDEEYMNIQSNNSRLTFSKVNSTSFKTYTIDKSGLGAFNLRVQSSLIRSFIKEGTLSINLEDTVNFALSSSFEKAKEQEFDTVITFTKQEGKDSSIDRLLIMTRTLLPNNGFTIYEPHVLSILNALAKVGSGGVLFKDSMIYTDHGTFKAFTKTDFVRLEMAIGFEALDKIHRIVRKDKETTSIMLWDVDNYMFVKEGTLVHGYQKSRSDISLGLEALDHMTPSIEFQIDLTDIVRQLKEVTINKASSHTVEYSLDTHYFTISDPGRSVIRSKVPCSKKSVDVLKFDIGIMKSTLTALYNKESPIYTVLIYPSTVMFKSLQGINLLIGRIP